MENFKNAEKHKLPENIRENVSLKEYSTFKIGGNAHYFCEAQDEEKTKGALDFAVENNLLVFVIGKGSNLLISDKGFGGIVIKIENKDVEVVGTEDGFDAKLGAGIYLTKMILDFQKDGMGGLEWAAGIPATLGGAIANNAGAHGKDMSESVKTVRVLEMNFHPQDKYLESYEIKDISQADCQFSYRDSIFKTTKKFVILNAVLSLEKGDKENMQKVIEDNVKNRIEKQPLQYPNIGSIFKNPVLSDIEMSKIFDKDLGAREKFKNNTIPAGWLIEQAGIKGMQIGGAQISEKHANFIVNIENATAEDVTMLISLVKHKIRTKFNVQLHEEIEYVGF
ncbi:MAG: UDP-N-acetylmuramate dehydrogenase [Candidatus Paceibacterota bacterium]